MRISFDLDDTLICLREGTPQEPRLPLLLRLLGFNEPLRQGTVRLTRSLRERGWEIWIYTTSNRPVWATSWWLRWHGVKIDGMVNQKLHETVIPPSTAERPPSKLPNAFGIDLHVDDSPGVAEEGARHGFCVVVLDPDDELWTEKVLAAADRFSPAARLDTPSAPTQ